MKKDSHNRREFLGLTGAAVAATVGGRSNASSSDTTGVADPRRADLVVLIAKVCWANLIHSG